jgi:hypothetical protein
MQPGGGIAVFLSMEQIPTELEAIGLRELAAQLRASAADTNNSEYVELFLKAAMALEKRACGAAPEMMEHDRYMSRH